MLSLNIVNIEVRWRQYCITLAVGNKIISSEKNAQPHLKNGFRNARGYRYGSYIKIKPEIQIWWLYSFIQSYLAVSGGAGATKSSARSRFCIIYFHTYQIYKKYNKFWTYQMMYEVISLSLVKLFTGSGGAERLDNNCIISPWSRQVRVEARPRVCAAPYFLLGLAPWIRGTMFFPEQL